MVANRFLPAYTPSKSQAEMDSGSETVVHNGGCHCQSVRWKVIASPNVVARACYCSYCLMRGNRLFLVPSEKFELLGDSDKFITTYTFGSHSTKYTFCKVCGITSFYYPRSNPGWVAVSCRSVDRGTLKSVEIEHFDGTNWIKSYNRFGGIPPNSKVLQ